MTKAVPPPGRGWLLVHELARDGLVISGTPLQERARFSYAREVVLLGQVAPAPQPD